MENPFQDYLTRKQIAELFGVKSKTTMHWKLPEADYKDGYRFMWLKTTIEQWKKSIDSGIINKTKAAN